MSVSSFTSDCNKAKEVPYLHEQAGRWVANAKRWLIQTEDSQVPAARSNIKSPPGLGDKIKVASANSDPFRLDTLFIPLSNVGAVR